MGHRVAGNGFDQERHAQSAVVAGSGWTFVWPVVISCRIGQSIEEVVDWAWHSRQIQTIGRVLVSQKKSILVPAFA